jgi:3-deoxy-D-manno-octulosonic-acid transferase
MSFYSVLSKCAFKALRFAEAVTGLPRSVSDALHFRRTWAQYVGKSASQPTLWIHGASVGELEDLANFFLDETHLSSSNYSKQRLIVTSSSPSAEPFLRKLQSRQSALYAGPLPPENLVEIRSFLEILKPELLVISHSDIWPLLLETAQKNSLSKGIVWLPAKAQAAQNLFENIMLPSKLKAVGLRREEDRPLLQKRLKNYPQTQLYWIGNARIERIQSRIQAQKKKDLHALESQRALPDPSKISILVGSAWPEDAAILGEALKNLSAEERYRFQIVVLPHRTDNMHLIASIQHLLPMARVLALQGVLLESYQNFDLAFVGGGFRSGLHNILEPILWGLPVACGPRLTKQAEAPKLAAQGALFPVNSSLQLTEWFRRSMNEAEYKRMKDSSQAAALELNKSLGAAKRLSDLLSNIKIPQ